MERSTSIAEPRPAATVILVRDGLRQGVEVFLLRRTGTARAFAGAYVFPGGTLEASDQADHWPPAANFDDASASRLLRLEAGGYAYWIAAIRESFEEAGILLARHKDGSPLRPEDNAALAAAREALNRGERSFHAVLHQLDLVPAFDTLAYLSHWVTPAGAPHRFDTRFFVALAAPEQRLSHDSGETVEHLWIAPEDALARYREGSLPLFLPTLKTLELLAGFGDCATLMAHAAAPSPKPVYLPRFAHGRDGKRPLLPPDYAYAEAGKLDPLGRGTVSYEIIAGVPVTLAPGLRRITAPNPGFMTGPGTNSYLLGEGNDIAVIDPGPALDAHIDRLLEEAGGRIRRVLVTHTHPDHSPAAIRLKERCGAELLGLPAPDAAHQDRSFRPDRVLRDGERIVIADRTLRVIHTPGHASNHLCYLLEEERILLTGDHLMQGSTVVIDPPDGNMAVYLESLRKVQKEDIDYLAPGHGFLIDRHRMLIDRLLSHRQLREDKVLAALSSAGIASLDDLLPDVYNDVPAQIHPVASRSLLAHLLKLEAEGRARQVQGRWRR